MPSRRHDLLARLVPTVRRSRELDDEPTERARIERWHAGLDRALPTRAVPRFAKRWEVTVTDLGFPCHVLTPRHRPATRTLYYLHGGGFMAPIDPFHVRYATRLADAIGARVVMPDYPLAPEHTWKDSHDALVDDAARWAASEGGAVLAGDSAVGGLALAVAMSMRDRGQVPSRGGCSADQQPAAGREQVAGAVEHQRSGEPAEVAQPRADLGSTQGACSTSDDAGASPRSRIDSATASASPPPAESPASTAPPSEAAQRAASSTSASCESAHVCSGASG